MSPTVNFVEKLSKEKQDVDESVAMTLRGWCKVQKSCLPLDKATNGSKKSALCSVCHLADLNKANCSFPPCSFYIMQTKQKHPVKYTKYIKKLQSELKALKGKSKQLEKDTMLKKQSFSSSLNMAAAKVQTKLINSNADKYLRKTQQETVLNGLIVNYYLRIL